MKYILNLDIKARYKIIFWLTLTIFLIFAITPKTYAQSTEGAKTFPYKQKFIISSYYSPLPNQTRYFKGNYERDVRLNGAGIHGADGTAVYPGLAAAPKDIPFGTKIDIPGFGIVAVHDRGGAIKSNRLDIWVGEGEEGLSRALGWGMRTVEVTVYGVDPNIKESVNFDMVSKADLSKMLVNTEHFRADLAQEDSGPEVYELQRFLKQLGYFKVEPTGYFGIETAEAVKTFQLDKKVIDSADDSGAGNFGPKSRVMLESLLNDGKTAALEKIPAPTLKRGDKGVNVKSLQDVLAEYGFLNSKNVSGTFDANTFDALVRFQIDTSSIKTAGDFGAGFYGPKTYASLKDLVAGTFTPTTALGATSKSMQPMVAKVNAFSEELALNDKGPKVLVLQEELYRLHFLGVKPTGYYGKITEHAVFKFQQTFGIVKDQVSVGAGVVGPVTAEKLNTIIAERSSRQKIIGQTTENKKILVQRIEDEKTLVQNVITPGAFSSEIAYGGRGTDIEKLQKTLKRLGFFQGRFTTQYFGDITKTSLVAFQKSHGLDGSGVLDEKTRSTLNQIIGGA
jgi:peptidoglycan hydrolase-like protein with peptidoglycan-binding domain/3D (Asp-Asp-Asp) domain-containing protein